MLRVYINTQSINDLADTFITHGFYNTGNRYIDVDHRYFVGRSNDLVFLSIWIMFCRVYWCK